jgi:hypothetical protein
MLHRVGRYVITASGSGYQNNFDTAVLFVFQGFVQAPPVFERRLMGDDERGIDLTLLDRRKRSSVEGRTHQDWAHRGEQTGRTRQRMEAKNPS